MAREQYDEKSITVLEIVEDMERVLERYAKKGWEPTSYVRLVGKPESVRIVMRKKAKPE